jgi:hypothetical protein
MPVVPPLLHEVAALADRSDAPCANHVRAGVAQLARMLLAKDSPFHTHTLAHDSRRADAVAVCLAMARHAAGTTRPTSTDIVLRQKLHTLAAHVIALALEANTSATKTYRAGYTDTPSSHGEVKLMTPSRKFY